MLAIFDCDGVLVDSEQLSNTVLSEALAELGLHLDLQQTMDEFLGRSRSHMLARTTELLGAPPPKGFAAAYDARRDAAFAGAGRIFSATEVERGKPAPDLFLHAAPRMGVAPAHCVVVEDAPAGVEAGRAAGMRVLGYGVAADARFDDMRALPGLLGL